MVPDCSASPSSSARRDHVCSGCSKPSADSLGIVMTQHWRQGGTLKLVRREPYQTASAKILPLHLDRLTAPADDMLSHDLK